MKLFVIAALVAVAAAGRLEHLERSYLPPQGSNGGFGSPSSHGSFGANSGGFGGAGAGLHGHNAGGNFAGATSNQYLPPNHRSSASNGASPFSGSLQGSKGGFGSPSSHGSFGANSGGFGAARAGQHGHNDGGNFASATSNQYLPPNHRPASSGGSHQGFGAQQNYRSQQYSSHQAAPAQQYRAPSSQFGSHAASSFGASSQQQYSSQSAAASRQYLAPNVGSSQQHPQQAFDEQTGYHY